MHANDAKKITRDPIVIAGWIAAGALLVLRIIIIAATNVIDDEAYYANWTRHLAGGYLDHAPGVAFLIKPFVMLFGENGFGVRIGGVVSFAALTLFLWFFGKRIKNERFGALLALMLNLTPFLVGVTFIMTIDTPLALCIFFAVACYYLAFFENKNYFYLAGVFAGLAMLSKISAVAVVGTFGVYAILSRERKQYLISRRFWLSFVIAGVVFSPFLIWNAQHDFASIRYALERTGRVAATFANFGDMLGAELGLYFPLVFVATVILPVVTTVNYIRKKADEREFYLSFITLLPLAFTLFSASRQRLEANWPLIAFAQGTFVAAWFVAKRWDKRSIKILFSINYALAFAACVLIGMHIVTPILPLPSSADVARRYYRYTGISKGLKEYYDASQMDPNARIFGVNYQIPAMVNLYVHPALEAFTLRTGDYHPTAYDYWMDYDEFAGKNFYFVTEDDRIPPNVGARFTTITKVTSFPSMRGEETIGVVRLYYCEGYIASE